MKLSSLHEMLPSTTVKTRPGGRDVFSSIPGLPLGRRGRFCCLLLRVVKRRRRLLLVTTEHATDDRQAADGVATLLLVALPLVIAAEAEGAQQLVDTEAAEKAVDQTAQAEGVEQLADEAQHTGQQETDGRQDLEQRLGHQAPEGVELFLCVRHVVELLLGVVDGGDDVGRDLLQALGQAVLLGSSLASALTALGLGGDLAVGVEAAKGAVALLQNAAGLLDEGLDVVDKLLLVELVAGCAVGLLDVLMIC